MKEILIHTKKESTQVDFEERLTEAIQNSDPEKPPMFIIAVCEEPDWIIFKTLTTPYGAQYLNGSEIIKQIDDIESEHNILHGNKHIPKLAIKVFTKEEQKNAKSEVLKIMEKISEASRK